LGLCSDPQVVDELYTFGQMMLRETIANTRALDSKAASLAAYGGAIITLLVSTSGAWTKVGNAFTMLLGAAAGISAFSASAFAAMAMALRDFDWISQNEWLKKECLSVKHETALTRLKGYRVMTIWGAMDSHKDADAAKVDRLKQSQRWLAISVFFVLLILLHIGLVQGPDQPFWAAFWKVL